MRVSTVGSGVAIGNAKCLNILLYHIQLYRWDNEKTDTWKQTV